MTKSIWKNPEDYENNQLECGDRLLLMIEERPNLESPIKPIIVTVTITETGFDCDDDGFVGYSPYDAIAWTTEKELCGLVKREIMLARIKELETAMNEDIELFRSIIRIK